MRWLLLLLAAPLIAATGDITAIRVVGSVTGVSEATSACNTASACTGWVAELDITGLSTGGTYALGIGANNDPTSAKLVCTVTSSGYDATPTLGTTTRTVWGTHQLRKIYNVGYTAPYPNDETVVSATLTLRIALSDAIYSGDTLSCNVGAGIYTQAATPTNSASSVTVTNNSTLTYAQARVIANWSWPGWTRITSNSLVVRAVGFQRHAKNGKPLAAMKFTCSDPGPTHTATATVTDMTIDGTMPDAGGKVQEYIGTLNVTGFTQGSLVTCNFAAYPWVGDATSVMDTSDGVNTMPTPNYAPQFYIMDAAGTYGTAAAVVDGSTGVDATCVAIAESAFNGTSDAATAAPCLTVRGAAVKIRAFNAATYTHADVVGTIYVKAGSYTYAGTSATISASSGTNPDTSWVTITPFPGVARSAVIFTDTTSSGNRAGNTTTKQKLSGVTINFTVNTPNISANLYTWFHNCSITDTVGSAFTTGTSGGVAYYTQNVVGSGGAKNAFTPFSSSVYPGLVRGNDLSSMISSMSYFNWLGNLKAPTTSITTGTITTSDATAVTSNAPIFAYNKILNIQTAGSSPWAVLGTLANVIGAAVTQNLFEINTADNANAYNIGGASGTSTNYIIAHNDFVGGRLFWAYNDTTTNLRTLWADIANIYEGRAIKTDTFPTASATRIMNWYAMYGVGSRSSVDAADGYSTSISSATVGSTSFQPEMCGIFCLFPVVRASQDAQLLSQPGSVSGGLSAHLLSWLGFVNRQAYGGGNVAGGDIHLGTGNGDYHLISSSPARSMVPSGDAMFPYDLDGVARKNDGTGAAGAYEYVPSGVARHRVQ